VAFDLLAAGPQHDRLPRHQLGDGTRQRRLADAGGSLDDEELRGPDQRAGHECGRLALLRGAADERILRSTPATTTVRHLVKVSLDGPESAVWRGSFRAGGIRRLGDRADDG
jgi:hypothetical protein